MMFAFSSQKRRAEGLVVHIAALACLLGLGCAGCAGAQPRPETPSEDIASSESPAAAPAKGGEQSALAVQPVGTVSTPSGVQSGAEARQDENTGKTPVATQALVPKKAPRPKMSGKAKSAFSNGKAAFDSGDLKGAQAQYQAAVRADSSAYQAHHALGAVYERGGQIAKAETSYKRALSAVPDYEASIVAYSLLLARQGRQDAAMSFLNKKAISLGKNAAVLGAMAEVRSLQGESGTAQELARESLKVDPNYKPAMIVLARDHYRARRIDLALYALRGILDGYGEGNPPRDKNNAEAHLLRGLIYSERALRGPAMEAMEKAAALRPDLVAAHLVLANYMMEAGNAKEARPHLESAIRYDNRNVDAHLQLGDAYRLLNRPDDARRELEWVLAAEPNQAAAHYNLGLLFLLGGKIKGLNEEQSIDKALEHLEAYKSRVQRGGPDDVNDLITRARTKKAILKAKQDQTAAGAG